MVVGLNATTAQQQACPRPSRRTAHHRVPRTITPGCKCISTGFSRPTYTTTPKPAPSKPSPAAATAAAWPLPLPQRTKPHQPDEYVQPDAVHDAQSTTTPNTADAAQYEPSRQPSTQLPTDFLNDFESRLEADVKTIGATVFAVTGVICFWRGVWSLLDHVFGDTIEGDIACCVIGLCIIFWIRISGARVGSFWPGS